MKYYQPFGDADPNASYSNGNALAGIKGSIPDARAIEHPMREILAVIGAAGLEPDEGNLGQLLLAIGELIADYAAPIINAGLQGTPTAPTQAVGNNSTRLANTAFVLAEIVNQFNAPGRQALAGNGYQRLPGKLILQWGEASTNASGAATVTLPIAFPTACVLCLSNDGESTASAVGYAGVGFNATTLSFIYARGGAAANVGIFSWFAIGY
jgi:hypothetical protein